MPRYKHFGRDQSCPRVGRTQGPPLALLFGLLFHRKVLSLPNQYLKLDRDPLPWPEHTSRQRLIPQWFGFFFLSFCFPFCQAGCLPCSRQDPATLHRRYLLQSQSLLLLKPHLNKNHFNTSFSPGLCWLLLETSFQARRSTGYSSAEIMDSVCPWILESPSKEGCFESIL